MRASNRVLMVIVAGVALLAIVALALGLVAGGKARVLPEDSPEGVVQRFLLATQAGDYTKAYDYLGSKLKADCAYDRFLEQRPQGRVEEMQAALSGTRSFDGRVEVKIAITRYRTSGPFLAPFDGPASSQTESYILLQEGGQWRFSQMPWPLYWCPRVEPVKPVP